MLAGSTSLGTIPLSVDVSSAPSPFLRLDEAPDAAGTTLPTCQVAGSNPASGTLTPGSSAVEQEKVSAPLAGASSIRGTHDGRADERRMKRGLHGPSGFESLGRRKRNMAQSLGELQQVQVAVAKEAGTPLVQINLMNGKYLSVGIVNSPLGKLPCDAKQAKALELARAAFQALSKRQAVAKVRVTFVVYERRFLDRELYEHNGLVHLRSRRACQRLRQESKHRRLCGRVIERKPVQ